MKKITSILLTICISFLTVTSSFAIAPSVDDKIAYLQELGLPKDFLCSLTDQDVSRIYEDSQSGIPTYEGRTRIFLYTDDEVSTHGTIPKADMVLDFYPLPWHSKDGNTYQKITVFVNYYWTTGHPTIRRGDGIAVNWDPSLFYASTKTFSATDYVSSNGNILKTETKTGLMASSQGGLGYSVDFPYIGDTGLAYTYYGKASFDLFPTDRMGTGNNKHTSVNVEYCHNKTPVAGSIGFGYNGLAVTISSPLLSDSAADGFSIAYGDIASV